MKVRYGICLHCGACAGSCPTNSIFLFETATLEFQATCTECGWCAIVCPVGAMERLSNSHSAPPQDAVPEVRP